MKIVGLIKNKWKILYLQEKAKTTVPFSEFAFKNNLKITNTYNVELQARELDNIIRKVNEKLKTLEPPFKLTITIDQIDEETK